MIIVMIPHQPHITKTFDVTFALDAIFALPPNLQVSGISSSYGIYSATTFSHPGRRDRYVVVSPKIFSDSSQPRPPDKAYTGDFSEWQSRYDTFLFFLHPRGNVSCWLQLKTA
jgi:hypothetical protein